jgi:hypothetical protein
MAASVVLRLREVATDRRRKLEDCKASTGLTLRMAETRGTGRRSLTCPRPSRRFGGGKDSHP